MRIVFLSRPRLATAVLCLCALALAFLVFPRLGALPSLRRMPGTFYMVNTQDKVIALTFDDGPDPLFTAPILDILQREKVKATFFVLGQAAAEQPQLLKRMLQEGHEIGNHGFSHDYRQRKLKQEISTTDQAVFAATNTHTKFYRPPGGVVSRQQLEQVELFQHEVVLWSLDSRDWLNPGPARIIRNVTKAAFPGAIVLLHDGGDKREQTALALETIIKDLKSRGFTFVTVSELKAIAQDDDTLPTKKPVE